MGTQISQTLTSVALAVLFITSFFAIIFKRPKYAIYLYCVVILLFTGTGLGAKERIILIYERGIGVLPLTLINIYLVSVFMFFLFLRVLSRGRGQSTESVKPIGSLYILLAFSTLYLLFGVVIDIPTREILSQFGIINIVNMCFFVFVLLWGVESSEMLDELKNIALLCLALSAAYGVFRFFFLGGDPANVYRNIEHLNVRLTYLDVGQSILFGFAFDYSVLKLLKDRPSDLKGHAFFAGLALLSAFNIIFSYRRNAWAGFVISIIWLIIVLDIKRKLAFAVIGFFCVMFLFTHVAPQRFSGQSDSLHTRTMTGDFTTGGEITFRKGRFSELRNATLVTLKKHPLFGFGPWGHYVPKALVGNFAFFTHSAIIHVLLKTGLIGLCLFCWPLCSLLFWTTKHRKLFPKNSKYQILSEAAFGGVLFAIPEILFGTPIIIYRHLQILGLFIALMCCSYIFRNSGTERIDLPSMQKQAA